MTVHEESRLRFEFGDEWSLVFKWDDHDAHVHGLRKFNGTKAVDFVGLHVHGDEPWFIEVKNFSKYRIENKRRLDSGELFKEVAAKVRASIASLVWACGRDERRAADVERFVRAMLAWKGKVPVILWLEDELLTPEKASKYRDLLQRELGWLNAHVRVMSRELAVKRPLPGVFVTGVSGNPSS